MRVCAGQLGGARWWEKKYLRATAGGRNEWRSVVRKMLKKGKGDDIEKEG